MSSIQAKGKLLVYSSSEYTDTLTQTCETNLSNKKNYFFKYLSSHCIDQWIDEDQLISHWDFQ